MQNPYPWLTDDLLKDWREILNLLDRPGDHADFPPALLDKVRRNRMEALVYQRFTERGVAIPSTAVQTLKGSYYARRYFYERYRGLALKLHACFSAAGVPCLFVKGLVVAAWFYDPPWCRPFSDIDVIVPFEAVDSAASILEDMGFEALHRRDLSRREREYIHALEFVHRADSNLAVELHHDLGVYSFHPGWHMDPSCRAFSPQEGLPTLALEPHVLFQCAHLYYRHYTEAHLLWLHDIHEALTRNWDRFDWGRFRLLTEHAGWGRGVSRVLRALDIYRDWSYPEVCRGLESSPSIRELVHLPREKIALFFAMGGNIPSIRGKLAFVLFHLCPPKKVMIERYRIRRPGTWFFYYPLRWAAIAVQAGRWVFRRRAQRGVSA